MKRWSLGARAALMNFLAMVGMIQSGVRSQAAGDVPAPLPPMGWSSWNSFSNTVDSQVIMEQAKALATSGLQERGYRYVNIDEGWWLGERDKAGNIVVDSRQWPALTPEERAGDMANIVRYIHSLGLKAGIYTDAGESGCSFYGPDLGPKEPHTGSEGHYDQDFLQFAKWGFDYVKVDWCGGAAEDLDAARQYAEIARAIQRAEAATGHPLFYSICNWGKSSPWTWAPGIGDITACIWRTSGDIVAPIVAHSPNQNRKASFTEMLGNFDKGIHPEAQHTGYFNDPDMMVVGMPGLSDPQNRVHVSLWAISGAPLIVGADLRSLSPASLATLTNREVLAVDQDPLGLQCLKAAEAGPGLEVWSKRLVAHGVISRRAVVLLNRTGSAAPITVEWAALGLEPGSAAVRDLWKGQDMGPHPVSYTATVAAGDVALLEVEGHEGTAMRYLPVSPTEEARFVGVHAGRGMTAVEIVYRNSGDAAALAELRINGQGPTVVAFPATAADPRPGTVTIQARLDGPDNVLAFSTVGAAGRMPKIDSISVLGP
jgi:hypothetical protein